MLFLIINHSFAAMKWIYKGKTKFDIPENAYGFLYIITYTGKSTDEISKGRFYIGKKCLEFSKKKKLTIKEKQLPENKRKRFKIDVTESDWKDYYGSSKNLIADIEKFGVKNFKREILQFCEDKINLTYAETKEQILRDVLNKDTWNISIGGKFFKGRIK